jgi:hypothetical protein
MKQKIGYLIKSYKTERRKMNKKKIAMFSTGMGVVQENGQTRKASAEEVKEYLVSLVPSQKKGAALQAVKFEHGFVYAKYDNGKVFRKMITAQTASNTANPQEPVNSIDKAEPSVKVPRDKAKAKPQIDVGRPDVNNPTEIRKDNYQKGKGGEDLHKGIPRSKSDGGLKGGKTAPVAEEKADKATSGKPDTYVQKFTPGEKPAPAGSEKNHAASSNVTLKSEAEIYSKVMIAEKEEDSKAEKKDEKDEKSLPPWLKKDKKKDEDKEEKKDSKEANLQLELKKAQDEVSQLKAELNKARVREARQKAGIKLALAYRDLTPEKYASVETFGEKVDEIVKKMNVEAIETALAEVDVIKKEASRKDMIKEASAPLGDGRMAIAIASPKNSDEEGSALDNLKEVLMANTKYGKMMADFESYVPHEKK